MKAMRSIGLVTFLLLAIPISLFAWYLVNQGLIEWDFFIGLEPIFYNIPIVAWLFAWFFLISVVIYFIAAFNWKRGVKIFRRAIQKLNEGHLKAGKKEAEELTTDFKEATALIIDMEERMNKQADRSQKLMDQWAEKESQLKNELVFQERNRIARELHDSVSQQLYAASMLLSAAVNQKNADVDGLRNRCEQIEKVVNDAQNDMRALLLQLRPIQLEDQSFKEGIEQLVESLAEKHPITFSVRIEDSPLSAGIEDQLFRIAQEAIANTLRHAEAREISLYYARLHNFAVLKVTDDGIGFERKEHSGGYGLNGIEERAEEIGATARIVSVPGQGTSIEIKVPIVKGEQLND
ncbi:sensor histidine kinase [Bacillus sp. JCM 19041]|uniref:sensor histidine kinase n=1 Tax=Bacillus sp. JCM 19041 TaxID=1460637 RepID=UPI0006D1AFCC